MADSPARTGVDRRAIPPRWLGAAALLVTLGAFLGLGIASRPIVLWDESRLAVNALEMSQRGFSLVTTYGFRPDLWNTKPPLLIWLEAVSIDVFGPSAWAVRLPSLLASIATVAVVMRFTWRVTNSFLAGAIAAVTLAFSPGYFAEHAAGSGDYDAPLALFTTAYILLLFVVLHRRRPQAGKVLAAGLLVAAACLTKGAAGLVPGVGVFAYLLVRRRWLRPLQTPWYAVAGLLAVALVGGYYLLREKLAPGYLAAVNNNELGGRYVGGMNGHIWGPAYYLRMIRDLFAFGPGALLPFIGLILTLPFVAPVLQLPFIGRIFRLPFIEPILRMGAGKSASFLVYVNTVALGMLLVFTLSRTKIFWYIVPIYPLLAMGFAIVAQEMLRRLPQRRGWPIKLSHLVVAAGAAYLVLAGLNYKLILMPARDDNAQGHYGLVFAALDQARLRRVDTVDGGVDNRDALVDYTPQRWFYTLAWRERGLDIRTDDPNAALALRPGVVLVTCDPTRLQQVAALGRPAVDIDGCAAVRSWAG